MILSEKILIANTGNDTLSYIDFYCNRVKAIDLYKLATLNKNRTIGLKGHIIGPWDIIQSKRGYIYCSNAYDNSIFKMDIEGKDIVDILTVGSFPTSIKYLNNHILVVNTDSNSLSIIDEERFSLVENIPVGEKPTCIEIDEINEDIYIVNSNSNSIDIINLNRDIHRVLSLDDIPLKLSISQGLIYILCNINSGSFYNSNISIIDLANYSRKRSISLKGIFNDMIKINSKEIIFVTNMDNGCLYRMDIESNDMINKICLNGMPNRLQWNGDDILYISNISDNSLTVLNIWTCEIIKKIKVGEEPNGILVLH